MQARELVELGAFVAVHGPVMVQGAGRVAQGAVEQYWTAARCRTERWLRILRQMADSSGTLPLPPTLAWPRIRPVLEEILTSELLARMWTAACVAYDRERSDQDLEPVARNVLLGHLDARRRLLQLLADGRAIESPQAAELNHLRRRVERWNDMLLAHLAPLVEIDEFAFEVDRARDFADDLRHEQAMTEPSFTCQLVLSSLRASFSSGLADRSPNADLNRRIGTAILGCFGDELLDSTGLVRSLWLERISQTASDTQGMIDELVRMDGR
jgi:hypothetical protein